MSAPVDLLSITPILRGAAWRFFLSVVAGLAATLLSVAQLSVITRVLAGAQLSIGFLLGAALGVFVAMGTSKVLVGFVAERLAAELRGLLFRRIAAMNLRAAEDLGGERMLAALTTDIDAVVGAVHEIAYATTNALLILGAVAYGIYIQPVLMLIVVAVAVPGAIAYSVFVKWVSKLFERARDPHLVRMLELLRFLPSALGKLKLSHASRQRVAGAFEQSLDAVFRLHVRALGLFGFAQEGGRFLFFCVFSVMLGGASYVGATPQETLSFAVTLLYLLSPLEGMLTAAPGFGRARVALSMLTRLDLKADTTASASSAPSTFREVSIEGVEVSYSGVEGFHFGPASARLEPGKVLFVTGGNGSGKSTFIKVLSGLYIPERGRIVWDGAVVSDETRGAYRGLFSLVLQDDALLADVMGTEDLPQDTELLRELSPGASFKAEKAGASKTLSHGQRSRIGLLEAWREDRPIVVLDEWAADQDPYRRKLFYEQVIPVLRAKGKCVVVISHDEAFFGVADVRIHLDRGRLDYVIDTAEAAVHAAV